MRPLNLTLLDTLLLLQDCVGLHPVLCSFIVLDNLQSQHNCLQRTFSDLTAEIQDYETSGKMITIRTGHGSASYLIKYLNHNFNQAPMNEKDSLSSIAQNIRDIRNFSAMSAADLGLLSQYVKSLNVHENSPTEETLNNDYQQSSAYEFYESKRAVLDGNIQPSNFAAAAAAARAFTSSTEPWTSPKISHDKQYVLQTQKALPGIRVDEEKTSKEQRKKENQRQQKAPRGQIQSDPKKENNEFQKWATKAIMDLNKSVGATVDPKLFFNFIEPIKEPNEVEDYLVTYFGESDAVKEFHKEFLEKRIALRSKKLLIDDLSCNAAASPLRRSKKKDVSESTGNERQNSRDQSPLISNQATDGKKKKDKTVDLTVPEAGGDPNRIIVGETDTATPVSIKCPVPSRIVKNGEQKLQTQDAKMSAEDMPRIEDGDDSNPSAAKSASTRQETDAYEKSKAVGLTAHDVKAGGGINVGAGGTAPPESFERIEEENSVAEMVSKAGFTFRKKSRISTIKTVEKLLEDDLRIESSQNFLKEVTSVGEIKEILEQCGFTRILHQSRNDILYMCATTTSNENYAL
uniref:Uncharacterized protein n=1 Tax=Panagrolaimus sp. ES5 TaxID=591445 RepID=A0AC34G4V7_9BILA